MWDFFKGLLFENNDKKENKKVKRPDILGILGVATIIYQMIFNEEFEKLKENLFEDKIILIINNILHFIIGILLIISVVIFLTVIIFIIIYPTIVGLREKFSKISEKLYDYEHTLHRFFLGNKIQLININEWLFVMSLYFFIFDKDKFKIYAGKVIECFMNTNYNIFIKIAVGIYFFTIVRAIIRFVLRISYRFLYFRMDDKTEKMLEEHRNKVFLSN